MRDPGGIALAHLVHQRNRVLQQRNLPLQRLEQAVARGDVPRLFLHRVAALGDRLIENLQVRLERRGNFDSADA